MQINHNIAALNTQNQLQANNNATQSSLEKLSSGMKINKAGDDAAGLAISEKMRGQIQGLEMAEKNAQDGISMVQTAEGAMNESHAILQRMRELSVQSANDTNTASDRQELQKEVDQLANALTDISEDTQFNEKDLLTGDFEATFQVGANEGQNLSVEMGDMSATSLGVAENHTVESSASEAGEVAYKDTGEAFGGVEAGTATEQEGGDLEYTEADGSTTAKASWSDNGAEGSGYYDGGNLIHAAESELSSGEKVDVQAQDESAAGYYDQKSNLVKASETDSLSAGDTVQTGIDISSQEAADSAISTIQGAIDDVSAERSKLGAVQNRLDHTINNLSTSSENMTAAESRIRDTDMASEMMEFTKNNILSQASQSMLAQAQQRPQGVLQLLQ